MEVVVIQVVKAKNFRLEANETLSFRVKLNGSVQVSHVELFVDGFVPPEGKNFKREKKNPFSKKPCL